MTWSSFYRKCLTILSVSRLKLSSAQYHTIERCKFVGVAGPNLDPGDNFPILPSFTDEKDLASVVF